MKSAGHVAVRVDANAAIGLGHLRRCVILAKQLRVDGFSVTLINRRRFSTGIESLAEGIDVSSLGEPYSDDAAAEEQWDAQATLSIIGIHPSTVSWVIVDNYEFGFKWERIIREAGHRVLAIDDYRDRHHYADLLLSDNGAPFDRTLNGLVDGARELVGPEFALIDPEFAFDGAHQTARAEPKRLLVSYGGSDLTNETSKALEAIRALRGDPVRGADLGIVGIVVGPTNPRAADVKRAAERIGNIDIHMAPRSLAPLLRVADIFLTAGGNSMVEALAMRKPCIVTVTSDNQSLMVGQLSIAGLVLSLGGHATVDPEGIADALGVILGGYEQVAARVRSKGPFDHLGAARVSEVVRAMSRK